MTTLIGLIDGDDEAPRLSIDPALASWQQSWGGLFRAVERGMADASVVIVVGVWHPAFAATLLAAARRRSLPVFLVPTNSLTTWDWSKHKYAKLALSPLLRLASRRINAVVVASSGEATDMRPRSFRRVVVVPHAVRTVGQAAPVTSGSTRVVLFAARVAHQKDMELLIDAVALLRRAATVRVCGDGDPAYVAELGARATRAGVDVEWLGWQSREQLLHEMSRCSVVAVTSHAENFCHSAAEAAAIGTNVLIVDRILSARDLGESPAVSVAKASPAAVSAELDRLLDAQATPEDREKAQAWAAEHWSLQAFEARWAAVLEANVQI